MLPPSYDPGVVAAALNPIQRDFLSGWLRKAGIRLLLAAASIYRGDDQVAEHDIDIARWHAREAIELFRGLQGAPQ